MLLPDGQPENDARLKEQITGILWGETIYTGNRKIRGAASMPMGGKYPLYPNPVSWTEIQSGLSKYEERIGAGMQQDAITDTVDWQGLESFLRQAAKKESNITVLDLMAEPSFVQSVGAVLGKTNYRGLSVGLEEVAQTPSNIEHIQGDINAFSVWKSLKRKVPDNSLDLITCRGEGGVYMFRYGPNWLYFVLTEIWRMLKVGGLLATQLPPAQLFRLWPETPPIGYLMDVFEEHGFSFTVAHHFRNMSAMQLPKTTQPLKPLLKEAFEKWGKLGSKEKEVYWNLPG